MELALSTPETDIGPHALLRRAARALDLEAATAASHAERHELAIAAAEVASLAEQLPARLRMAAR